MAWLAMLVYVGYDLQRSHDTRINRDLERLVSQTDAIEQNLVRQLEGLNNALVGVRYALVTGAADEPFTSTPGRLKLLADAIPGVYAIQVLNREGRVIAASRHDLLGNDFSQRSYFRAAVNAPDPSVLHLSPPFLSIRGDFITVLSRAVVAPDGQFAGVVSTSLDPDYFATALRSVLYAADARATMVHGNGTIIVSTPKQDAMQGLNLNQPGSMFSQHLDSHLPSSTQHGILVGTNEHRIMALRTISPTNLHMDYPLVVRVSRRTSDVLRPWRAEARLEGLLLLLGIAASGGWLLWQQRSRYQLERTAQLAARAERESARRLEFGLRGADLGLWEWDIASDTVTVNAREMEMMGYAPTTAPLASHFWRGLMHPDEIAGIEALVREHLRGVTPAYRLEHRCRHKLGHWVWVLDHAMVMERDDNGQPRRVVGTHLDITERKRSQLELEHMNAQLQALSLTDGLTGVANRRQFDQALAAEWARGLRQAQPLALLMIDVDHFKLYNDRLGHPEGDACLRTLATLLSGCLRQPVERLARYGGEEFVVLLIGANAEAGAIVAQRCLDAVTAARLPHPASPLGPHVTLSIGVASCRPRAELDATQLLNDADAALYAAKKQGRARYVVATAPVSA